MTEKYTKSNPKIQDYNPLTHASFYSKPQSLSPISQPKNSNLSNYDSPKTPQRSIHLAGKQIFSYSPIKDLSSKSFESLSSKKIENPIYSKISYKNKVTNPISGEVKIFNLERPRLQYLDKDGFRDKFTEEINFKALEDFHKKKLRLKPQQNIAGSLRKEIPFVSYVNPFLLKSSLNNS